MGIALLIYICVGPINLLNGLSSVRSRWCAGHETLWPVERCFFAKKVGTKYMQVNLLGKKASMTKRGNDMPTHWIGRQCPDALGM